MRVKFRKISISELEKIAGLNGNDTQGDVTLPQNGKMYQLLHLLSALHSEHGVGNRQTGTQADRQAGR